MLDTKDLITTLGVSRNWINEHMRDLGHRTLISGKSTIRKNIVIVYEKEDVLAWLNENAIFERQTIRVPPSYFGRISDSDAQQVFDTIASMESFEERLAAHNRFIKMAVPQEFLERDTSRSNVRKRIDPWVAVTGEIQITDFKQLRSVQSILHSLNPYSASLELAYRHIYNSGMIRVTIKGRVWYIDDPAKPLPGYSFLFPAHLF